MQSLNATSPTKVCLDTRKWALNGYGPHSVNFCLFTCIRYNLNQLYFNLSFHFSASEKSSQLLLATIVGDQRRKYVAGEVIGISLLKKTPTGGSVDGFPLCQWASSFLTEHKLDVLRCDYQLSTPNDVLSLSQLRIHGQGNGTADEVACSMTNTLIRNIKDMQN